MFTQRLYRSLGLAAHLGWARLLVDRYRDLKKKVLTEKNPRKRDPNNIKSVDNTKRSLAGGGHSAWSAPPRAVDEDPDEAGALLDFHFTNPSAGSGRVR